MLINLWLQLDHRLFFLDLLLAFLLLLLSVHAPSGPLFDYRGVVAHFLLLPCQPTSPNRIRELGGQLIFLLLSFLLSDFEAPGEDGYLRKERIRSVHHDTWASILRHSGIVRIFNILVYLILKLAHHVLSQWQLQKLKDALIASSSLAEHLL